LARAIKFIAGFGIQVDQAIGEPAADAILSI